MRARQLVDVSRRDGHLASNTNSLEDAPGKQLPEISAQRAREVTDERTWRVELRRPMSETLTGSVALVHSDRDGSPFLTTVQNSGAVGSNLIAPVFLARLWW